MIPAAVPPLVRLVPALALALAGGWVAKRLGLPLPWMLGSLLVCAAVAMALPAGTRWVAPLPSSMRAVCVGIIGVLVGGTFTPELVALAPGWWPTLLATLVVTLLMQFAGYAWLRHGLKLDPPTAWFASAPGGLVESVTLGEANGGDLRVLSVMHFLRIVIIVVALPLGFSLWRGEPVGSAAGVTVGDGAPLTWPDALVLLACLGLGLLGGQRLKVPAGAIVAPLLLSGAAHASGLVHGQVPPQMVVLAQWIVGASLGLRFAGLARNTLLRALVAAATMMVICAAVVAVFLVAFLPFTEVRPEILILSFAPGGVVEMGLIALSLGANPVFVTTHHVFRILVTVMLTPRIYRARVAPARTG